MRQPPRRRTVPFPGSQLVPYEPPTASGLEDLDPTRIKEAPPASSPTKRPRRKISFSKRWLLLPAFILVAGSIPLALPYISPVWDRLPRPDWSALSNISLPRPSLPKWAQATKPAPAPVLPTKPIIIAGNDPATCEQVTEKQDHVSKLSLAGVVDSVTIAQIDSSIAPVSLTCRDRIGIINSFLADMLVTQELYAYGTHGEMVEKTSRELQTAAARRLRVK